IFCMCGESDPLTGVWRAVLSSSGGELPFILEISAGDEHQYAAVVRNGDEALPFSRVERSGSKVTFIFEHYDSIIEGELDPSGLVMTGEWSKRSRGERRSVMNFTARRGRNYRFTPLERAEEIDTGAEDISGDWTAYFGENPETHSHAVFHQEQDGRVTGTFMTTTGDYRFLEGTIERGVLRLSVFDGVHAYLFEAEVGGDGVMNGQFWSGMSGPVPWTATKGGKDLPDPYSLTHLTNKEKKFRFSFPGVDGVVVSDDDERFEGKALLVYIFGTWCPNCNDEAPLLVELYNEYNDRGLEVIGLANEYAGDFEKDSETVRKFSARYDITWPILIVGPADKRRTQEALSDLDRVLAYPTTIFIDRSGEVYKIHTGFTGPGTGKYYEQLKMDFRQNIEEILANK
ncbi:TlpA disulfide reductase family protein, partial [candidate division KSB1 bacterium]